MGNSAQKSAKFDIFCTFWFKKGINPNSPVAALDGETDGRTTGLRELDIWRKKLKNRSIFKFVMDIWVLWTVRLTNAFTHAKFINPTYLNSTSLCPGKVLKHTFKKKVR